MCVCWVWFPCDEVACAGGACEDATCVCEDEPGLVRKQLGLVAQLEVLEQTLYEEWCGGFCDTSCNVRDRQPLTLCP